MEDKNLILLKDLPNRNQIIEEIRAIYGDALIDDILNNQFEEGMQFFYNDILIC